MKRSNYISGFIIIIFLVISVVVIIGNSNNVKATIAGPQSAGTGSNDTSVGSTAWTSTANIISSDDSRTIAALSKNGTSNYLTATNFDFSTIPDGAIILGITIEIERSEAGLEANGGVVDNEVRIIQGGTINTTQNKADTATLWPTPASENYANYGDATDLWGLSWTSAQVKASNFGVAIAVLNKKVAGGGAAESAQVDHIRITVDYSADPNTDQNHFRWRNDDGTESTATWIATEDNNTIGDVARNTAIRLRMKSHNTGIATEAASRTYELQWGLKSTDCASIGTWTGVANTADEWDMTASQLIEGTSITTERLTSATTFANGEEREVADTTGSIGPLSADQGTELEFSLQASSSATGGSTYCFRLYDTTAGSVLDAYSVYPEATVASEFSLEQAHYRFRNDDGGEESGSQSSGLIRPDGDSSVAWATAVPSGTHYSTIDEVVTQPMAGTTSDYIQDNAQSTDDFTMGTLAGSGSYNQVDVWVYAMTAGNERVGVNLVIGGTPLTSQAITLSTSYAWYQVSFTGLTMNQTDLDGLVVRFSQVKIGGPSNVDVATMYSEVFETVSPATWKANEDTDITGQATQENIRTRFLIDNNGPDSAGAQNYRLEFASMVGADCLGGDETFSDVPNQSSCGTSHACMKTTSWYPDQGATINVSAGLTDPGGSTFVAGNVVEDTSNQTNSITLVNNNFTEVEYNFEFTTNATSGGDYCLRVNRGGTALSTHTKVARVTLVGGGGGGYTTSGTYISSDFDTGDLSAFNVVEWTESVTDVACGASCDVRVQIKTAPDSGGSPGTWSTTWSGPEGEDGDETDYFTISNGELIHTDHNGDQWIRYRITLDGDGTETPIVENISINYQ